MQPRMHLVCNDPEQHGRLVQRLRFEISRNLHFVDGCLCHALVLLSINRYVADAQTSCSYMVTNRDAGLGLGFVPKPSLGMLARFRRGAETLHQSYRELDSGEWIQRSKRQASAQLFSAISWLPVRALRRVQVAWLVPLRGLTP